MVKSEHVSKLVAKERVVVEGAKSGGMPGPDPVRAVIVSNATHPPWEIENDQGVVAAEVHASAAGGGFRAIPEDITIFGRRRPHDVVGPEEIKRRKLKPVFGVFLPVTCH